MDGDSNSGRRMDFKRIDTLEEWGSVTLEHQKKTEELVTEESSKNKAVLKG